MQLTKHTDYAFRVLIYLAGLDGEQTTIKQVTEMFDISKTHLMKVVNKLANIGWVKSTRGKNGGITLALAASEIRLDQVVVEFENTLDPINCESPPCYLKSACGLKPILIDAQTQYLAYLSQFTIEDLMNPKTIKLFNL